MTLLVQYTLIFASVLALVALGGCFSEHSGVINIGLEGIMVMGALGGALAMKFIPASTPGIVLFILIVLTSVLVGMVFSLFLGVAAIHFNADQTLVGTALNLMGTAAAVVIVRAINVAENPDNVSSTVVYRQAKQVFLVKIGDFEFNWFMLLVVLAIIASHVVLYKTKFGLRLCACGEHPQAADSVGISVYKMRYAGVLISGALGGLGGLVYITAGVSEWKFAGCYHGHSDALLVSAGSGVMTSGVPDSAGVPKGCTQDTMTAVYNDLDSVRALLEEAPDQVAAVIVEAVGANMGVVPPKKGFLEGLRTLCDQYGTLLIFDEVITGFRLAFGGAAEYFGVKPDMVTYGKIIGAGMPVGAYGGRKEIMQMVSPAGPVYQAGTLSGNPIAMAAGLTQLKYLYEHQEVYKDLEAKGQKLYGSMEEILKETGSPYQVNHVSSLGSIFFATEEVRDYTSAKASDTKKFAEYFLHMLKNGIHLAPSQFEAMFLSTAHSDAVIEETLDKVRGFFTK